MKKILLNITGVMWLAVAVLSLVTLYNSHPISSYFEILFNGPVSWIIIGAFLITGITFFMNDKKSK